MAQRAPSGGYSMAKLAAAERIERMRVPIPTRAGTIAPTSNQPLAQQRSPARLIVRRVSDEDSELLRHFQSLGVTPGTAIELVTQEPFEGPLVLKVGGKQVRLTPQAAKEVFVDAIDGLDSVDAGKDD